MRAYVGQKQLPAFFKLAGGWKTKEHEIRTGLTAQRCGSLKKQYGTFGFDI